MADLRMLLGDDRVKFVGIADVREDAREMVKSTVDGYYKNNDCKMYRDAAEILARPDIDALLIATSDRWHGLMAMWAAQSGKDMYIEKPGAMSINESYAMADNVRRYGVVYQSGAQRKNQYAFEFAVGLARSGKLGRLTAVHADTAIGLGTVDAGGHSWWPAGDAGAGSAGLRLGQVAGALPVAALQFELQGPRPRRVLGFPRGPSRMGVAHGGDGTVGGRYGAHRAGRVHSGRTDLPRRRPDRAIYDPLPVRQRRATDPAESQLAAAGIVQQPV